MEVNPNYLQRTKQRSNVIDARFIDTESGFFIDITGLANVDNDESDDPILKCKSVHLYNYSEIFPLVRTVFENVPTWRPYKVEACLVKEYKKKAITNDNFNGYKFSPTRNEWFDTKECSTMERLYVIPSMVQGNCTYPQYRWKNEFTDLNTDQPGCLMEMIIENGESQVKKGYWDLEF